MKVAADMNKKPGSMRWIAAASLLLGSVSFAADAPRTNPADTATAVFAGGCFWGVDAVFKHVKGVSEVVSGYAGGDAATANYRQVSRGGTGHAEAVSSTPAGLTQFMREEYERMGKVLRMTRLVRD